MTSCHFLSTLMVAGRVFKALPTHPPLHLPQAPGPAPSYLRSPRLPQTQPPGQSSSSFPGRPAASLAGPSAYFQQEVLQEVFILKDTETGMKAISICSGMEELDPSPWALKRPS